MCSWTGCGLGVEERVELGLHRVQGAATAAVIIEEGAAFEGDEDQRCSLRPAKF